MPWPITLVARDRFVLDRRRPRVESDPWRYQDLIVEEERAADGTMARSATVLLTGRECPWRCVMCDLWTSMTATDTPPGAIPAQVRAARDALAATGPPVTQFKLYNAGSFFDPRAVPESDYQPVAALLQGVGRLVVESHPALVGSRVGRLLDALERYTTPSGSATALEVAMGLETAHPSALERLHKRMTVEDFVSAGQRLRAYGVAVRTFLLISPPFVPQREHDQWLLRSVDVARECGGTAISLIPTRAGNGALDELIRDGEASIPCLPEIERSVDLAMSRADATTRVFVDLWDLDRFLLCPQCHAARRERLHAMNREQRVLPRVECGYCADVGA